jgi:hypothetical protein
MYIQRQRDIVTFLLQERLVHNLTVLTGRTPVAFSVEILVVRAKSASFENLIFTVSEIVNFKKAGHKPKLTRVCITELSKTTLRH